MIYTFYSFKGGVGRSMALANLAELFYRMELRVLMVDFDLEAPSLERFFAPTIAKMGESLGLIDMLCDYKKTVSQPLSVDTSRPNLRLPLEEISPYLLQVYADQQGRGKMFLLPAGRRVGEYAADYANRVGSFDWSDFLKNWEGTLFFEWLKHELCKWADLILIDSRTGISEMSTICTEQLADVIVMFCAQSHKNLEDTHRMAQYYLRRELVELRGRPLGLLVIPARLDNAEMQFRNDFMMEFQQRFAPLLPMAIEPQELWEMAIPYIPYFAYANELAVQAPRFENKHYYKIAEIMSRLDPKRSSDSSAKGIENWTELLTERFCKLRERITETATVFISYAKEDRDPVRLIYTKLLDAGFDPWLDEENLHAGQDWRAEIEERIETSDFVIVCLSKQSIYKRGFVQKEIVWALDVVDSMPEGTVYLIPIRLENCEVPERLSRWQWLDMFVEGSFERLEKAIRLALRSRKQL